MKLHWMALIILISPSMENHCFASGFFKRAAQASEDLEKGAKGVTRGADSLEAIERHLNELSPAAEFALCAVGLAATFYVFEKIYVFGNWLWRLSVKTDSSEVSQEEIDALPSCPSE